MTRPKVLLINPPETEQVTFNNPPLALLYLAGTLKKNKIKVKVIDGYFEGWKGVRREIQKYRPTIVGVPCLTPFRHKSFRVAKMAKKINPQIVTILGGAHATIMPAQIMENYSFVDLVVRGEGEKVLLDIAKGKPWSKIPGLCFRENGRIIFNPPQKYYKYLDRIPFPDWSQLDLSRYPALSGGVSEFNGVDLTKEPRISVIFSRGCPGSCNFCSTWWIWRGWRGRTGKNMADELELLYQKHGIRHFCFADDCMTTDRQAVSDLCEEIKKRKLRLAFNITTRTDTVDFKILTKLRAAGCYLISYGIESASPKILNLMNKKNTIAASEKAIRLTRKAGIKVAALMITGNVGETWQTVNDSIRFLQKTNPEFVGTVGCLWVLPGTALYADLKNQGVIAYDFWLSRKKWFIYRGKFTPRQLRYLRHAMEKRTLVDFRQKPWNSPVFLLYYYLESLVVSCPSLRKIFIGMYWPIDKLFKKII